MINVQNMDYWGFEHAVRGMRNPMDSWHRTDSGWKKKTSTPEIRRATDAEYYDIGDNDLNLMQRLFKGGTEHRKYLRQIFVSFDITAPLYWWKEFDTYKIGTTSNSCSTMHTIHKKEFELDDFSYEHLFGIKDMHNKQLFWSPPIETLQQTISSLNYFRKLFLETNDKKYWWQMIQLLPSSYNQRRTVTMNYENVFNILQQRSNHKLDEWKKFCLILRNALPYIKELEGDSENGDINKGK